MSEAVSKPQRTGKYLALMSLTALGVVFGDIGTSPLYALRECFTGEHALAVNEANVLGVLSLIVWSLMLVITFKYMLVVLKADNNGEGGILALMALVYRREGERSSTRRQLFILSLGLFGSALLYGDGVITPAISVLSAIEGLKVATPVFEPYILSITTVILIVLFSFQRHGTAKIGALFGPIMLIWFVTLGALGIHNIFYNTTVFAALNPLHAVSFFIANGWHGWIIL